MTLTQKKWHHGEGSTLAKLDPILEWETAFYKGLLFNVTVISVHVKFTWKMDSGLPNLNFTSFLQASIHTQIPLCVYNHIITYNQQSINANKR